MLNTMSPSSRSISFIWVASFLAASIGFYAGLHQPKLSYSKLNIASVLSLSIDSLYIRGKLPHQSQFIFPSENFNNDSDFITNKTTKNLPPKIIEAETDLYFRTLWGDPLEDLHSKPKYLAVFIVGLNQKENINKCVQKFSKNFTLMLFHYDGRVSEWDEYDWSKEAIHVSAMKQGKWWYIKRFLHPDVVAPYEYIFLWDEDLGVENFDAEEYIRIVKKHGLEISQPAVVSTKPITWEMTKKHENVEVHKVSKEKSGRCPDKLKPPCAGFVEIMAPVFTRKAWRCIWYLIQNDLINGWGLDFTLGKCVETPHEQIGVVDAQWIVHMALPTMGLQGQPKNGEKPWKGVRDRCIKEWEIFKERLIVAESFSREP